MYATKAIDRETYQYAVGSLPASDDWSAGIHVEANRVIVQPATNAIAAITTTPKKLRVVSDGLGDSVGIVVFIGHVFRGKATYSERLSASVGYIAA